MTAGRWSPISGSRAGHGAGNPRPGGSTVVRAIGNIRFAVEVYVRPFPSVDSAKFAISVGGGLEPLWRRDGTELYFRDVRGDMHVVAVSAGKQFEHAPRGCDSGWG
ncbi:MAG TPA: hypothetical protein VM347_28170 [Nonomuraea sp.]|nr:hypothetical protein [Nonomuraea sp.]